MLAVRPAGRNDTVEPLEIVRAYDALFETPSREQLDRLVTDDFVLDDNPIDWHIRGKADLWRLLDRPGPANPQPPAEPSFVVEDYVGDETKGAARWRWHVAGRSAGMLGLPRTDRSADATGVAMVEFQDGKLSKLTEYWDAASVMRQLGAEIPSPRAPAPATA
jgi:steroid delta-isomerase-like uncharacterized protein